MANPPTMRTWTRACAAGRHVHVYSDAARIVLQLRCDVPTTEDVLAPSFKVAVRLSAQDALALAGELLTAAARSLECHPPTQGNSHEGSVSGSDALLTPPAEPDGSHGLPPS